MRLLWLALACMALSACQLSLAADVAVDRDGSGTVSVVVALDEELATLLEDAGANPLEGLQDAEALAPEWSVQVDEQGGLQVTLSAEFGAPGEFERLLAGLHDAVDPADGALFRGMRLAVDEDGAVDFSGQVGLVLPEAPGAEGAGVRFDADDLDRLLRERGDELVRYELRLTLPGPPDRHDADDVSGRTLTWRAPVGDLRQVSASSPAPSSAPLPAAIAVLVVSVAAGATGVVVVRRRGGRPRESPAAPSA